MKLLAFFISILFISLPDLSEVRKQYIEAAESEKQALELFETMEGVKDNSSNYTLLAYKAAAYTLRAKYEKGLLNKKNLFTTGAKMLEQVIENDSDNYEARLIRLSIQANAPKITGYTKNIEEDKSFIIKYYDAQSADLKEFAKGFISQSSVFSASDKAMIK